MRPTATVTFASGVQVQAEIVDTPDAVERGLMFRESLGPNEGMLFVFEKAGFYPFWMKNTLIPLDIIWIDEAWRIVSIAESVPPCRADPCPTYPPAGDARYVVEVSAGFCPHTRRRPRRSRDGYRPARVPGSVRQAVTPTPTSLPARGQGGRFVRIWRCRDCGKGLRSR